MLFSLNKNNQEPIYQQIYHQLKNWILSGEIKKDAPLPSKRQLAKQNQISINTVMNAYHQLQIEGYIYAKERTGYFVADIDFQHLNVVNPATSTNTEKISTIISMNDWVSSQVDSTIFPFQIMKKLYVQLFDQSSEILLQSSSIQGDRELRRVLQQYLIISRGVPANAEQMILGPSSIYLLSIILSLTKEKIKVVGIENPGYHRYLPLFERFNIEVIPLPVDESGLKLDSILSKTIDLLIVTPNHQFPTGSIMPLKRRQEILNWANQKKNRWIIEDDYDSEYKYSGLPIPSLSHLDTKEKVIYMSSFSRTLASSFRLSYCVLPQALYQQWHAYQFSLAPALNTPIQKVIAQFIEQGYLEKHLNRSRIHYKKKRDVLIQIIKHYDQQAKIEGQEAGLHILYQPSFEFDSIKFKYILEESHIRLNLLSDYTINAEYAHSQILFLSFSQIALELLDRSFDKVWKLLDTCRV